VFLPELGDQACIEMADVLVERSRIRKQTIHIRTATGIKPSDISIECPCLFENILASISLKTGRHPVCQLRVENGSTKKHPFKGFHLPDIPVAQIRIEVPAIAEHVSHIRHISRLPARKVHRSSGESGEESRHGSDERGVPTINGAILCFSSSFITPVL
jgi:hypothetical protein